MAIFTAIAAAIGLTGFFASAFVTLASIATSIGLSYAAKALSGNKQAPAAATDHFSAQGVIQTAGDVPRSFNLGYSVTAGSMVYANTWGNSGKTPNAYLTQVIALADLPGGTLSEVWINGELCTLTTAASNVPASKELLAAALAAGIAAGYSFFGTGMTEFIAQYLSDHGVATGFSGGASSQGLPIVEYRKDGLDHLWIKYYDGTQTTADTFLTGTVSSSDRPWSSTRVGTGIAYVICTSLVEDTLFTGFPTFKFALSGISLYDPSKDSTNGGSGTHRYSDTTTWGGDGDKLPAVQIYNILRGFHYGGQWLYGLQTTTAGRLPATNWVAQIAKCRATITGESGAEPTYRSGGQINVSAQSANAIEAILTSCQGRLSEIGGFYKLHLGTPDSASFSFTDDDILSTEEQIYKPFFALADSVNGIQGTYPDPAQGWNTATAPAYYRTDLEILDGNRRLMANPSFDFVPYRAQVQRLQKSAIEEAQRARTHVIALPPVFWLVEPGDVGSWTSTRNGYVGKLFRADGVVDKANLDVALSLTEIDPADYDWTHSTEFTSVTTGVTVFPRPAPQGIVDWYAEGATLYDADGIGRRPAIRLSWDGTLPGIVGVQYEVRLKIDSSPVTKGRTDQLSAGAIIVTQSLIPNTQYQVRGQYLPSSPRDMLWSSWLDVTTPNVLFGLPEFDAGISNRVTTIFDQIAATENRIDQLVSALASIDIARNWIDKKNLRSELSSITGAASARFTDLITVATNATSAVADRTTTLEASINTPVTGALARLLITSTAVQNVTAQVSLDPAYPSAVATEITNLKTTVNNPTTGVSATSAAVSTLQSQIALNPSFPTAVSAAITSLSNTVNNSTTGVAATSSAVSTLQSQIALNPSFPTAMSVAITNLSNTVNNATTGVSATATTVSRLVSQVALDPANPSAISAKLDSFTTTINGHTASIATTTASVDGVAVNWGVVATIRDSTGAIIPGGVAFTGLKNAAGAVIYTFAIRGDLIVDGSVTAQKITVNSLSAFSANIGTVTAGIIRSADSKMSINLNTKRIVIQD